MEQKATNRQVTTDAKDDWHGTEEMGNYQQNVRNPFIYDGNIYSGMETNAKILDEVKRFQFYEDDLLVSTYPRSGTTWTNAMLYLILNDVDLAKANCTSLHERTPFLDLAVGPEPGIELAKKMSRPRHLKTHLPIHFFERQILEGRPRVIYVYRNPKDALVSVKKFYAFMKSYGNLQGTMGQFLEMMYAKRCVWGDWFEHTKGWWTVKDQPNVLVLRYEDMKMDPERAVLTMAEFVGKSLTKEQVNTIVENTTVARMRDNPATNYKEFEAKGFMDFKLGSFINTGEVGGWRHVFTVSQNERFDAHYQEKMKGCDIKMMYKIGPEAE